VNQSTGEVRVIEVNPRVSRSSALASKATGYPIARMAAKIAVGYTLDELPNPITGEGTTAAFEPTLDYCVVKIPRWPFDKFRTADRTLGTSMKSTGEVMAIGRCFEEAFLKAWASLEQGAPHPRPLTRADESEGEGMADRALEQLPDNVLIDWLRIATDRRMGAVIEAFRRGWTIERVHEITRITRWFLYGFQRIANIENEIVSRGCSPNDVTASEFRKWKSHGFSDGHIADALSGFPATGLKEISDSRNEQAVMSARHRHVVHPIFRMVDSCAAEFAAKTPYYYSTYEPHGDNRIDVLPNLENRTKSRQVVIGSGPIRIGQGIEFDYGCVHAVKAIREAGMDAVLMNNNPETVSTDFDTSDRLYFEPLTLEYVTEVLLREKAHGILLQFGGQTAINLALPLEKRLPVLKMDLDILGTTCDAIDEASDRERFEAFAERNGIRMPRGATGTSADDVRNAVEKIGFPVLIRPSYVLGGRGMEILANEKQLEAYLAEAYLAPDKPLLVDEYLGHAIELDVDAASDGNEVLIGAVMEHLEEAGIHSGDSTCFIPTQNIPEEMLERVREQTRKIGIGLNIRGCFNIQFAIQGDDLYCLEVNPRSSRTVPFVAKATGVPMARIAARVTLGINLSDQDIPKATSGHVAVKAPVFPFIKLQGLDPAPGPEMKSTGEVYGSDLRADVAYLKARLATEIPVAKEGGAYLTVRDEDKDALIPVARELESMGFAIYATPGTADLIRANGIEVQTVYRITDRKHPDALDLMRKGQVSFIVNVPTISGGAVRDGNMMRRLAVEMNITFVTTKSGAVMEVAAIKANREVDLVPMRLTVNY
ncbi:MAG: carbamoyl-phosphate synthase large subunit, partial [Candidatus Thermoplasmatota archaeon]|nr:carbamoyl-phosphate synthase large subunit [Candidatus Thermoplasmatota archaeon]